MNARIQSLRTRQTSVTYCGIPLVVSFEYEPEEFHYWDDVSGGYPGSPANVTLLSAKVCGVELYPMLDLQQIENLEELVLEQMQ